MPELAKSEREREDWGNGGSVHCVPLSHSPTHTLSPTPSLPLPIHSLLQPSLQSFACFHNLSVMILCPLSLAITQFYSRVFVYLKCGPDQCPLRVRLWQTPGPPPKSTPHLISTPQAPPPFQSMATYPSRLRFYDAEVQQRGMEGAVHAHLPRLMPGVSGAALHPLIHTGWAADVGSDTMLAEGLAYLDAAGTMLGTPEHPGAPPNWAASPEGLPILEASLAFVTRARELGLPQQTADTAATPEYKRRGRGGFQHKVMTFADPALPHAAVLEACGPLQLPALEAPLTSAIVEATALAAAGLYASNNEFFVLHTLTSLHGVLALQPALSPQNRRELLAQWWRAAMAALVALQLPAADTLAVDLQQWQQERGEERRMQEAGQPEALAQQRQADDAARRVDNLTSCDEEAQLWRAALDRALTSEDEHVPKAVYTLWRWSCFEGMPPSSRRLFRRAAMNQVRPVDGNLAESLWFSAPGHSEPPRKRL